MSNRKECETEEGYGICPSCIHYSFIQCPYCNGEGFVNVNRDEECPQCNGEGKYYGCELGFDLNGE